MGWINFILYCSWFDILLIQSDNASLVNESSKAMPSLLTRIPNFSTALRIRVVTLVISLSWLRSAINDQYYESWDMVVAVLESFFGTSWTMAIDNDNVFATGLSNPCADCTTKSTVPHCYHCCFSLYGSFVHV